jgi:hypothetical protein
VNIVSGVKRQLHREIVADPLLHGLVLNLYLNGEQYPHRAADYFPLAAVEDAPLEARMRQHMREEDKHAALYIKAIGALGQPVQVLALPDVYNEVIRAHTPARFAMEEGDDRDLRTLKLANFLAHLHYLEKRIARSLEFHAEACERSASPYVAKAVRAVLKDEGSHVVYTHEAVQALLPRRVAAKVFSEHRRAERRANLDFSSRQLGRLVRDHGERFGKRSRFLYRCCSDLLGKVVFHA